MLNGLLIRWQLARAHTEPIPPLISSALCCHSSFPFIIIIFSLARCSQNENEMKIQDENDGFVHKKDFLFFSLLLYFMCFYISTAPWAGSESTANKEIQFNDSLPARTVFPWRSAAEFVHVLDFHEFFIFSFFPFYSFNFASTIDNNTAMSIEYNKAINKKGIFCSPVYQHGSPCAHCVSAPPHYDKMKIWSASGLAHSHKFQINRIWRMKWGKNRCQNWQSGARFFSGMSAMKNTVHPCIHQLFAWSEILPALGNLCFWNGLSNAALAEA